MKANQVDNVETLNKFILQYNNRGLTNIMVARVYILAYDDSHAYGYEAVAKKFESIMYELFHMDPEDNTQADTGNIVYG